MALDVVAAEPPGAPAYEHHVVTVPYDAVGVQHPDHGVLLVYRHRFTTDTSGLEPLRFHFVHGLAGEQIAVPADVHEATALYWVPVAEVAGLVAAGLIPGSPSLLALLYAERFGHLDGAGA